MDPDDLPAEDRTNLAFFRVGLLIGLVVGLGIGIAFGPALYHSIGFR